MSGKRTIARLWRDAVAADRTNPAYLEQDGDGWRPVSWQDAAERVDAYANGLLSLADVARRENDYVRTNELVREGLAIAVELGSVVRIVQALETLAALASAEGPPERAARLIGGCEQLRRETGFALFDDAATYARTVETARTQLGSEAFDRERSAGAMLTRDGIVAYAVGD